MPLSLLSCCRGTPSPSPADSSSAAYQSIVLSAGPPYDAPIHAADLKRAFQMLEADAAALNLDASYSGTGFSRLIARGLTLPASDDAAPREFVTTYERAREIYGACYRLIRGSTPDWCDRPVRRL